MEALNKEFLAELQDLETDEEGSVELLLCPEGSHVATIGMINLAEQLATGDGKDGPWYSLKLPVEVSFPHPDSGEVVSTTIRHNLFVDLVVNDDGRFRWNFLRGKNRQLALLRQAVDQNNPGHPWSVGMLSGQVVGIEVVHRDFQAKDGTAMTEAKITRFNRV
jgi:hypothetical protein